MEGIQELGPTDLYRSLDLEQTEEGVRLRIELTGPTEFRTEPYSGGPFSIAFHFRSKEAGTDFRDAV